jgi:hypothetical protein
VSDLVVFVSARLDEAAARAWAVHDVGKCDALLYEEDMAGAAARTPDCDCGYPARALREVEAGRRILDLYVSTLALVEHPPVMGEGHPHAGKISAADYLDAKRELAVLRPVIEAVAAVFSDHPDYRPEEGLCGHG